MLELQFIVISLFHKGIKMVNERIKIMCIKAQLYDSLTYMLKEKKKTSSINDYSIWIFENKVHFKTFKSP
jgi:hypothetical protein